MKDNKEELCLQFYYSEMYIIFRRFYYVTKTLFKCEAHYFFSIAILKWWRKCFQTVDFSLLECTALRNVIKGLTQTLENQCNIKGKRKMSLRVLCSNIVWTAFLMFSFCSLCFLERSSLASRQKWNKVYLKSILYRFWWSLFSVHVYYCYSA